MIPTVALAFRSHLSTDAIWSLVVAGSVAAIGPVFLRFLPGIVSTLNRFAPVRIAAILTELSTGVSRSLGRIRAIVLFSALGWAGESAMLFFVARAAGTPISVADAGTVALVTALLTTIPVTPGGIGVAETGIVLMLTQLGVTVAPAAAIALLARAISFGSVVFGGGIVSLFAPNTGE